MNVMFASAFNLDTSKFVLISLHEPVLGFMIVDCISWCKMCIKGIVKHNKPKFGLWIFHIHVEVTFYYSLLLCFQQKVDNEEKFTRQWNTCKCQHSACLPELSELVQPESYLPMRGGYGRRGKKAREDRKNIKESWIVSVGFCRSRLYSNGSAGLVIWGSRWEQLHQSW